MTRKVNSELINTWIDQNSPLGIEKLAIKSSLSASLIACVRRGKVPARSGTRSALSRAIESTEDALFPIVGAKGKAS